MKSILIIILVLFCSSCIAQKIEWVKTEGEITNITVHGGKRTRETAIIKYKLPSGEDQLGSAELFRIPFIGSMKSKGDIITINYQPSNPVILETVQGKFLATYGIYILIFLGIIFSIKPFINYKKSINTKN